MCPDLAWGQLPPSVLTCKPDQQTPPGGDPAPRTTRGLTAPPPAVPPLSHPPLSWQTLHPQDYIQGPWNLTLHTNSQFFTNFRAGTTVPVVSPRCQAHRASPWLPWNETPLNEGGLDPRLSAILPSQGEWPSAHPGLHHEDWRPRGAPWSAPRGRQSHLTVGLLKTQPCPLQACILSTCNAPTTLDTLNTYCSFYFNSYY